MALLLFCTAKPLLAQETEPLDAEGFEAQTLGRTFRVMHESEGVTGGVYGMESFLPNHQVIWEDADRCVRGIWEMQGQAVCFRYADKADRPVCWLAFADGQGLRAARDIDPERRIRMMDLGDPPLSCPEWLGS